MTNQLIIYAITYILPLSCKYSQLRIFTFFGMYFSYCDYLTINI